MPSLPLNLDTVKEKLKRERLAEAGVIAATVAVTLFLSHALRLALENYTILGL
jgi:hypothetical protein